MSGLTDSFLGVEGCGGSQSGLAVSDESLTSLAGELPTIPGSSLNKCLKWIDFRFIHQQLKNYMHFLDPYYMKFLF